MVPGTKVLIVEDEEILASNLKSYLDRASCETRVASDGASAIELIRTFCPDVLVLDFRLPDMSGFDTLDAVRQCTGCDFRCVLMTGHPTGEVYSGAARRGIEHILFKPFPLKELTQVVCQPAANGRPIGDLVDDTVDETPTNGKQVTERRRWPGVPRFPLQLFDGSWLAADRRNLEAMDRKKE